MGSCYSGDHILQDHIHTEIKTYNIGEPQQKYRLGTVSNKLLGRGGGRLNYKYAQSNFNGSNTFGTMNISSRQG